MPGISLFRRLLPDRSAKVGLSAAVHPVCWCVAVQCALHRTLLDFNLGISYQPGDTQFVRL